jgi:hypothetical protein
VIYPNTTYHLEEFDIFEIYKDWDIKYLVKYLILTWIQACDLYQKFQGCHAKTRQPQNWFKNHNEKNIIIWGT